MRLSFLFITRASRLDEAKKVSKMLRPDAVDMGMWVQKKAPPVPAPVVRKS